MANESRRWQRRLRRRQKSCRSDCEPREEGCSCCDSCTLPNIIRRAVPILRMVPHIDSPGAASIGASKNPSLFPSERVGPTLCAICCVQYRSRVNFVDFISSCDVERMYLKSVSNVELIFRRGIRF